MPNVRRIGGRFLLGQLLKNSTIRPIANYLAREDGTNNFRLVKILTIPNDENAFSNDEILFGKVAIHTEHSLLKILQGQSGVVQQYGLFKESVTISDKQVSQVCLVLDCYISHDFSPAFVYLTNLYLYTRDRKKLEEMEAIKLFFQALCILRKVHEANIIHQDLNMRNFILNTQTGEVTLSNFNHGRLLTHSNELITRNLAVGSLLHQSPENIKGQPFVGKPSDMWSMGVIFYALLFSEYPFHSYDRTEVLRKISSCSYAFPSNNSASSKSTQIIQKLLLANPASRPSCQETLDEILVSPMPQELSFQVVPQILDFTNVEDVAQASGGSTIRRYKLTWDQGEARVLKRVQCIELPRGEGTGSEYHQRGMFQADEVIFTVNIVSILGNFMYTSLNEGPEFALRMLYND